MADMRLAAVAEVFRRLRDANPHPTTELEYASPFQLLVAVVLSAQATDVGVNKATRKLYPVANTPQAILDLGLEGLEGYIKTIGLYKSKARHLMETCRILVQQHGGEVPRTREALEELPGVGRKTANVVLFGAFGINEGLAVDTHVKRISYRLGLTEETDPVPIERDLMKLFPREDWGDVNHRMVWFGREVCEARKPLCGQCEMAAFCPQLEPPKTPRPQRKKTATP